VSNVKRQRKRSITLILAVLVGGVCLQLQAGETYYRWKDEQGRAMHSDRPPPTGTEYEVISSNSSLVRKVDASEGAVPASTQSTPGNEFQAAREELEVIKKNPEMCTRARGNLDSLQSAARIRLRNANGEYEFLSDEEKQKQIDKAQDLIDVHCE
jgi:hypothetical protein